MMSLEQKWELAGWGHLFLSLGFPILVFWGLSRTRAQSLMLRIGITTLLTWFLRNAYRASVEISINTAYARARGDEMYDGVGGNVVIMLLGWFEPLVISLLAALIVAPYRMRLAKKTDIAPPDSEA